MGLYPNIISNQVFLGLPWKTVRPKYDKIIDKFKIRYPLSFIIVGREDDQNAEDLLQIIKDKLYSSSSAIFDASGGNANVSLEYGLAESKNITCAIYITKHKRAKKDNSDSAIISDLAGKRRNEYKVTKRLAELLSQYSNNHPYTKRFEAYLKKKYRGSTQGTKKTARNLSLKIIHCLDDKDSVRRSDIVSSLQAQNYNETDIERCLKGLHASKLIRCSEGKYSTVSIV